MSQDPKKKAKKATKAKSKAPYERGPGLKAGKKFQHFLEPMHLQRIVRYAQIGLPIQMICYLMDGMSEDTFKRYRDQFPEIDAAYKKGRAEGLAKVAETTYNLAISGKSETTSRWWLEKMAPQMLNASSQDENPQESETEISNIDKDRIKEALKKDKFIDIVDVSPEPRVIDVGGKDAKKDGKK